MATTKEAAQAVKYLLGELPEDEQSRLEERSFCDPEFSELLSEAEDDLVDQYVRGELSAQERERFERHFLISKRRREKVGLARALLQLQSSSATSVSPSSAKERPTAVLRWKLLLDSLRSPGPALSYAFAAAALVLLMAGFWLRSELSDSRGEVACLQTEGTAQESRREQLQSQTIVQGHQIEELSARKAQLEHELARLRQKANAAEREHRVRPNFLTLILTPGYRSTEGPNHLTVPRGASIVRVQLSFNPGDDYPSYQVQLHTAGGDPVRNWKGLRARLAGSERAVSVDVPAKLLNPGQYELMLEGVATSGEADTLGYYYFNLRRSP
jgi:hypothetical protein